MNIKCNEILAQDLDPEQLNAVEAPIGNTCTFAIAGAGKTRVLTYRVANLIDNGYPENSMMLLTFTNKASAEMITRIKKILNKDRLNLLAGTFHNVACRFLRRYANEIGYSKSFSILNPYSQYVLMNNCRNSYIEIYGEDDDEFPSKAILVDIYSGAINHELSFSEYIKKYYPYYEIGDKHYTDGILLIFEDYVKRKQDENLMDFDDLLLNFLDILNIDKIKEEINKYFKYIFVDEYQDINWIQYEILEKLNSENAMFVIGDKAQCIYQFRGSRDEYIDLFEATHDNVQKYKLTYNYRSTPEILLLAEKTINNNELTEPVVLNTKNEPFSSPLLLGTHDEESECKKLALVIKNNYMDCLSDVAILVRKGAQIGIIEKALKEENISCNLVGAKSFYDNDYVKNLIALVQLRTNYANEDAFIRAVKLFPGVGTTYAETVFKELKKNNFNFDALFNKFNYKVDNALSTISNIINVNIQTVSQLLQYICDNFYKHYMEIKYENFEEKYDDIQYLIDSTNAMTNVDAFLDVLTLDKVNDRKNDKQNSVTVITMHKAKGLEWDNVFLPFLDKGEFPRCRDKDYMNNEKNVQNERNLFYVAITRAKKQLIMSYSMTYSNKDTEKSPFLREFDDDDYAETYLD